MPEIKPNVVFCYVKKFSPKLQRSVCNHVADSKKYLFSIYNTIKKAKISNAGV